MEWPSLAEPALQGLEPAADRKSPLARYRQFVLCGMNRIYRFCGPAACDGLHVAFSRSAPPVVLKMDVPRLLFLLPAELR